MSARWASTSRASQDCRFPTSSSLSGKLETRWTMPSHRVSHRAKRGLLKKGLTQVSLLPDMYYCNGSSVTIAQLTVVHFIRYGNRSQKLSHTDGTWSSRYD